MKKLDLMLGPGREALTRDQMKAVTGGFEDGRISCAYTVYDGGGEELYSSGMGACGSTSHSVCMGYAQSAAQDMAAQLGGTRIVYGCS